MRTLTVLSMHTSPLAQPGLGDGGGMNVYVRELSSALARAGVACAVYTRAADANQPAVVRVEPGLTVHHVPAGPLAPVDKEDLPALVDEFTAGVLDRVAADGPGDAVHANYWLSGVAGHRIKHELDLPLVSTFHTLDRVKAEVDEAESQLRATAESRVMECSDAILASCAQEADELVRLYGADPARVEIVHPGVDHAFFSPGDRAQARRALGLRGEGPLLLFVGRIQPLKGLDTAVLALAGLDRRPSVRLVVVGGPSGRGGEAELTRVRRLVTALGLDERVLFVPPQPHELLSTFYRAADVCLVPSRTESFGLVALEAAACGTPVVAAAVGGLRTVVEHGTTGFLVEERDPTAYAARVDQLLGDSNEAAAMGQAAAGRARGYTWALAAARLRELYARLTARQLVECP